MSERSPDMESRMNHLEARWLGDLQASPGCVRNARLLVARLDRLADRAGAGKGPRPQAWGRKVETAWRRAGGIRAGEVVAKHKRIGPDMPTILRSGALRFFSTAKKTPSRRVHIESGTLRPSLGSNL